MANKDLYETLGIDAGATLEEVRRAYRRLARTYHPDVTGGDKDKEALFHEITRAYDVLSDPGRRAAYDAARRPSRAVGTIGHRPSTRPVRMRGQIEVTLIEATLGAEKTMILDMPDGGEREITLHLPPGIADGEEITLEQTSARGLRVELALSIRVREDPRFRRRGLDLEVDVEVPFERAILGGSIDVPALAGPRAVEVPPGSSSGRRLHLPGEGAADRSGRRGDLSAVIRVTVPAEVPEELRAALLRYVLVKSCATSPGERS